MGTLNELFSQQERQVLKIDKDTKLDPKKTYGSIIIEASNITIDGCGAWVIGDSGDSQKFKGNGIYAKGVSKVTLRNVNVKGFETGLRIEDGEEWLIEGCDFSDNFHDPDFGWGENGRRGGIVLTRVHKSTLRKNKANRVWDACVLVNSNDNKIEENDFSHTSDTCLKFWTACRNEVRKNDLSYGIRIKKDEVHARDSTSVLIESGSNNNKFIENNVTYGGDGFFIRVLNSWVSTGNLFEGNDASYANNNCFESWSPGNTFIRNKANHGSYGFWMGGSDKTVMIGNEAAYNGDPKGNHNAPEPGFGHGGIVFVNGPSSHTIVMENYCHHNNGGGIVLRGDLGSKGKNWKAFHWIIQQNKLEDNRWGIYVQHADWVDIAANECKNNQMQNLKNDGNVTNLTEYPDNPKITKPPKAVLNGPSVVKVGEKVIFNASKSSDPENHSLSFHWDFGDGTISDDERVEHIYNAPGSYRLGLTVNNGLLSNLAWIDLYAIEEVKEVGTEGQAADWDFTDDKTHFKTTFSNDTECICGKSSLKAVIDPYSGELTEMLYPTSKKLGIDCSKIKQMVFWIKCINTNISSWQKKPIITLYESESNFIRLTPPQELLTKFSWMEGRDGWTYFEVPLTGDDKQWQREGEKTLKEVNWITLGFDSYGYEPLIFWIDGLAFK